MAAPFRCPLSSRRRRIPGKEASAPAAGSSSKPASSSAARAARALSRLWRPGTFRSSAGPGWSSSKARTRCSPARPARLPSPGSARPRAGSQNRAEGLEQLGARGPVRVVVELDVGHHRHLGAQAQEARVGLVRLGDDPFAGAPAGVPGAPVLAGARQLAAEQEARVGARARAGRGRASRRWWSCRGSRRSPAGAFRRTARRAARPDGSPAGRARGPARARDCPPRWRSRPPPRRPAGRRRRRGEREARGRPPGGARGMSYGRDPSRSPAPRAGGRRAPGRSSRRRRWR